MMNDEQRKVFEERGEKLLRCFEGGKPEELFMLLGSATITLCRQEKNPRLALAEFIMRMISVFEAYEAVLQEAAAATKEGNIQ